MAAPGLLRLQPAIRAPTVRLSGQSTSRCLSAISQDKDNVMQTRFSYFAPAQKLVDQARLFAKLKDESAFLNNPLRHNAAVLLATPHFARLVEREGFVGKISRILAGPKGHQYFHILCAIVDHVPPASKETGAMQGISVLRGWLDDTMPDLWDIPTISPQDRREQTDILASLTFDFGKPKVTVPLTRTIFDNARPSTLIAARYDVSGSFPKLMKQASKQSQTVKFAMTRPLGATDDFKLWAPLSPLTKVRKVTDSFGNIVRGIEIDETSQPASTELESAVHKYLENTAMPKTRAGPIGIWAMVIPKSHLLDWGLRNGPSPQLDGAELTRKLVEKTNDFLNSGFRNRGHIYQVLSGGGGWGAKKGLLSLDPQRTHIPASEEEEMARFMQVFDKRVGFAPPGSWIQFFTTPKAPPEATSLDLKDTVFGVPSRAHDTPQAEVLHGGYVAKDHFGALSKAGIFIAGPSRDQAPNVDERKLSVPGSAITTRNREYDRLAGLVMMAAGAEFLL